MRYTSAILLGLLAASCQHSNGEISRYHEDGRAKPIVAVASMIDTSSYDAAWSLSEEFTTMIANQLAKSGQIFVKTREDYPFAENPFSSGDLSWMKREFYDQEFVVFLELVEHESVPAAKHKKAPSSSDISSNLNMAVRLRVIDLRAPHPKVVLQEMVRDSYFVPKTLLPVDYTKVSWGTEDYRKTPMGIAHAQVVQEVSQRINDYILLAKSR
jgi:hypothetical protein